MDKKLRPYIFLPFLALSACASQEDLVVVKEDVQKVKTQTAGSYSEVQQLRDEVARLQGKVEEMTHGNAETFGRLGMEDSLLVHKVDELDSRLQKIEQYLAIGADVKPVAHQTPQQQGTPVNTINRPVQEQLTDSALFKEGVDKLSGKNYRAARESFGILLQKYPKSELASNAQFNIGESYFSEKSYEKAILEYQVVIEKYPKSGKRPSALYKQAVAFEMIGDEENARTRFRDIVKLYPKSSEALLAGKKLQAKNLK
ncbi:MAG: tol-pal system protein YbgF [Chlorobiaceae bacterium]|nr:tol-pal system protein YbgF [Chlorobiaceae bacterium]NTW10569.1 tol-pal system protein YbgF [Chlorobiaceae bacterium]